MSTGKYLNSINESQMSNSLDLNAWGVDTKLNLVGLAPVVRRLDNAQGHSTDRFGKLSVRKAFNLL